MVMIEMVYCKITGKTRDLPKIHHFIPIEEWAVKKVKGKRKVMPKIIDTSNDGPSQKFQRKEQVHKQTLYLPFLTSDLGSFKNGHSCRHILKAIDHKKPPNF